MIEKVKNFIEKQKMINGGETVLAGVSGGADSVCLFYILKELSKEMGFDLQVVHINHMIREEAEHDAAFVESICKENGIKYYRRDVDIPRIYESTSLSEEEAGRVARYEAFEEIADSIQEETGKSVVIATAHNMNDQAETMLHNLFRGSRLKGLSGIKAEGSRGSHKLIRPILILMREEIEDYLNEKGIAWCKDATNDTDEYTRNRIRHNILPVAEREINVGAIKHAAEAAAYISEVDDFLDELAGKILEKSEFKENGDLYISCKAINEAHEIVRSRAIMGAIKLISPKIKDIQSYHIETIARLSESTEGSAKLDLPYGVKVTRSYDDLIFSKRSADAGEESDAEFTIDKDRLEESRKLEIDNPVLGKVRVSLLNYDFNNKIPCGEYTKWFDYDKISCTMSFRARKTGDVLAVGKGTKTLKKLMIDEKIPADMRDKVLVLADKEQVLWLPGYRISENYKVNESTKQVLAIEVTQLQIMKESNEHKAQKGE
ncbi:MAG: tRNA lysidine(34) synthetase TilS [Butyrivibrio sp.]|nr:tRNA lysidine(34) synthetase TilS [Butyrivibrio sp.]